MTLDTHDEKARLERIRVQVENNFADNVMPFWAENTGDAEYGGFLTRLDRRGQWLDTSEKVMIMQVRMIASLSLAHRHGLSGRGYLELAGQGFEFLTTHMWDEGSGGFHYSVTREGKPKESRKNTDFHAYAITGLSEYHLASGRREPLEWAERVLSLLLDKAVDDGPGFIEDFDGGDWDVLNADQINAAGQRGVKTIDMHTNMLEALVYLGKATRNPQHLDVLQDLFWLIRDQGIHPEHGCTISAFDADFTPRPGNDGRFITSYGLNVELAWLLLEAVDLLGEDRDDHHAVIAGLVDHALEYGFDHERGGVAAFGPMTGRVEGAGELGPARLHKVWWEQAELLIALTDMYRWTGESRYLTAFEKLWGWVWKHQIDHDYGDWYEVVDPETGEPLTMDKGGEFKTAFHVSRALVRVSNRLGEFLEG